jgi:hypothetical protein
MGPGENNRQRAGYCVESYLNIVDAECCDVLNLRAGHSRWFKAEHDIQA